MPCSAAIPNITPLPAMLWYMSSIVSTSLAVVRVALALVVAVVVAVAVVKVLAALAVVVAATVVVASVEASAAVVVVADSKRNHNLS